MLYYVELEKYESRYTLQLTDWNLREFKRLGVPFAVVSGEDINDGVVGTITTGEVLDAHGRSYFALTQMANLIGMLRDKRIKVGDVIFFEDMFHPGLEALAYTLARTPKHERPLIAMRCLAQTVDPDDFVNRTGMASWMRHYEHMADNIVDLLLVHSEEMVANIRIAGWKSTVAVTGCPFSSTEVQERVHPRHWSTRENRVVFASRFDEEKQPLFFLEVVKRLRVRGCTAKFFFLSGRPQVTSNSPAIVSAMVAAHRDGLVEIVTGLRKDEYYHYLATSRVLFNCALQDWVSNTACEADALGCNLVYPAYRSFPETFNHDSTRLYVPWSVTDAANKVSVALSGPHPGQGAIAEYHDRAIERTLFALGLTSSCGKAPSIYGAADLSYRRGVMRCRT